MSLSRARAWLAGSMRRQLVFGVALVHAVIMSLFIWDLTSRQQEMQRDQQLRHARALARNVATSAAGWLLARDVTGLQEIVDAQMDYSEVRFAMALDRNGVVLAHTDPRYLGKYLADLPRDIAYTVLNQSRSRLDVVSPVLVAGQHVGWIRIGLGGEQSTRQLDGIVRNGILYALAAILIGGVLAGFVGFRLARRLNAIENVIDMISAGETTLRAPEQGDDEPARLARRFNEMLDTLERREKEAIAVHEALTLSEARFQRALRGASDGLWDWDLRTDKVFYSPRWKTMLGYREDELEDQFATWERLVDPEGRTQTMALVQACLEGKQENFESEFRMRHKDGHWVHILARGHLDRDSEGRPACLTGTHVDITERVRSEEALRLTQFSLDHAPDGVFWLNREAGIDYVNEKACLDLGYTREELLKSHIWDIDPSYPMEFWPQHWESSRSLGARTFETTHRHKNGTTHPVEIAVVHTSYAGREHHTAFVRDISRRKADEANLLQDREQQQILREMLEDAAQGADLKETLGACLTHLFDASWLSLQPKGGIFLVDNDGETLKLAVSHNLPREILSLCERVPFGRCLCGRAAASREMQASQCVDHHHEITYPGMADHGHYNLPMLSEGVVVGVLLLYLPLGFARDESKERFLSTVADALAGFIRRKRAEESLRHLNEDLEGRVALRTSELLVAKLEAERASRAKSEFLSRMSHELRTPLNAILGFGQLLELDVQDGEQADNVQEILRAGQHLLELINEVLDLARIEAGRLTLSLEPVPLVPLIEDCLMLIRPLAERRGIVIGEVERACGEYVRADRVRLKQVLLNLLSNGVKYNREGGSLAIDCMSETDAIRIRVRDSGPGLDEKQQAKLFVAFERLDADMRAIEGTGIGLALSKRLMELMGGGIGVESEPGQGSVFWIRLPTISEYAEAEPVVGGLPAPIPLVEAAQRRWDVLCIEDNPANMRLIERILARRADIRLLTASTPGLGLELAMAHHPVMILLDINLPDIDGYDVMKCLREREATRDIPVVAISANAMPGDLARGKAAGFADYLTKPIGVDSLLQVVDRIVAQVTRSDGQS